MKTLIKNRTLVALAAFLFGFVAFMANDVSAQSGSKGGYSSAAIASLKGRNSAAQYSVDNIQNRLSNRSVVRPGVQGVNQRNFLSAGGGSALSRPSKPFSSVQRGPTVSPYLALSSLRSTGADYQSLIRPQQRQQRENQRQQAYSIQRQHQLNKAAARAPYSITGDENRAGTGHVAVFQNLGSYQNTGSYFPPASPPKKR